MLDGDDDIRGDSGSDFLHGAGRFHLPDPIDEDLYDPVFHRADSAEILNAGNRPVEVASDIGATDDHHRGIGNECLAVGSIG
jgi:hypothetical protein